MKGGKMRKINSVQNWLPYQDILENGIIKQKKTEYIKIIKINPINFNLKSNIEKETILNSYKIFLKSCNFNFQILIQSNKENLSNHISKIKEKNKNKENNLKNYLNIYVNYINNLNEKRKSSCKIFYLIIKEKNMNKNNDEKIIIEKLNENYLKIKEGLSRCGNNVQDINEKKEVERILKTFLKKC